MKLFLTLKLYLHKPRLFNKELFWHFTECKQNLYLAGLELFELTE